MTDKELTERSIRAIENNNNISSSLVKHIETLTRNMTKLNDNFVLHAIDAKDTKNEVSEIRTELIKYLKWSIFALLIAVGGVTIIDKLGILW